MGPWAYSVTLVILAVTAAGMVVGGPMTWLLPVVVFGAIPLIEAFFVGNHKNHAQDEEAPRRADNRYDLVLYAHVPVQVAILLGYFWGISTDRWAGWDLAGVTASVGICCGAVGINLAHELGHRGAKGPRNAARILLLTTLYMHFIIEHNRGHHARVATPEDPASARRGENVFAFWIRSVVGSYRSAWALEAKRLNDRPHPNLSLDNEMLRYQLIQAGALLGVGLGFGWQALLGFLVVSTCGILLLETVNYVEHYGLSRAQRADGKYERVQPIHSWTSDRPIGRALLFELTRHADHHANAARPFQILRHFEEAPELPQGYPAMILLALFPPLWFRVMDPWVDKEQARLQGLMVAK